MSRPVVITGLGPITAFGVGIAPLWNALVEGRSAIKRIQRFDAGGFACRLAAELPDDDFDIRKIVPKTYRKSTKVMCRDVELAVAAAGAAVASAGIVTKAVDPDATPTIAPDRLGCQIGAGLIAADVNELTAALVTSQGDDGEFDLAHWGATGMTNLTPLWLLKYLPNMLACHVTIVHDCQGPSNTITCCEASSTLSLGESLRVIDRGAADACLTGGAEAKLNPMAFIRQAFAGRLADTPDDDPRAAIRPFDPKAHGTILGEGGGILVVEAEESARARNARAFARVTGFATTQSFCRDTVGVDIAPDDPSLADAIEAALASAKCAPDAIDAIVPFGSGIAHVDEAEIIALTRVFGERVCEVPIVTTVPHVGNCNAGNGAVGLCVAAKCIDEQRLPARLNTDACERLDANQADARAADLGRVLVMTTSQGGQNAAVVLERT